MVQASYDKIGGVKGSGLDSPEEMIKNIQYWKIVLKNSKSVACILYKKDKNGRRKAVVLGCDGTRTGLIEIKKIIIDELREIRSYGEVSGDVLQMIKNIIRRKGWKEEDFFIDAEKVADILDKETTPTGKNKYNL